MIDYYHHLADVSEVRDTIVVNLILWKNIKGICKGNSPWFLWEAILNCQFECDLVLLLFSFSGKNAGIEEHDMVVGHDQSTNRK